MDIFINHHIVALMYQGSPGKASLISFCLCFFQVWKQEDEKMMMSKVEKDYHYGVCVLP